MHALLLNEQFRQIAAEYRDYRDNQVKGEYQRLSLERSGGGVKLVAEIRRSPEQEEPPDSVSQELADNERPCLAILESLGEGDGFLLRKNRLFGSFLSIVLVDIFQLCFVHMFALLGLFIHIIPEEHPDKTKSTDDDERPFPAESLCQRRDAERSSKSSD